MIDVKVKRANFNPGQQDGCGGCDGSSGGHTRHSGLRSQLVWKHGCPTTSHGVCASGESNLFHFFQVAMQANNQLFYTFNMW